MKSAICCYLTIFTAAITPLASAVIINVPADYPTIQAGIDASNDGDTVLVAPGEYQEDLTITWTNICLTSSHGPDTTEIRGHVTFGEGVDTTCVLQGFTVTGRGHWPNLSGNPAILCTGDGKAKITGNIVRGNESYGNLGGGIGIDNSNAVVRHNIIEYNWAVANGGGVYCVPRVDAEISHNIIRNNWAGLNMPYVGMGAGIHCTGGRIHNNLIYRNEVGGWPPEMCGFGGGIAAWVGSSTSFTHIFNNTIVRNISQRWNDTGNGAGVIILGYSAYHDTIIVENNIIAFNHNGGVASVSSDSLIKVILEYDLFFANTKYDLSNDDTSETHIFGEDPLFVDTSVADYHLLRGSPCIDAGDPDSPLDPDSTRADIGAYFYDQRVDILTPGEPTGPYQFQLHQNYPNPFNSQTVITYTLPEAAIASLSVYSITGELVTRLVTEEWQGPGAHTVTWDGQSRDGTPVATGIYFYELKVNEHKEAKAMIVIR